MYRGYKACCKGNFQAIVDPNVTLTLQQASYVAQRAVITLKLWIASGFLKVAPKQPGERKIHVFVGDLLEALEKPVRNRRSKSGRGRKGRFKQKARWYVRHLERMRLRRLLELSTERDRRLAAHAAYCRKHYDPAARRAKYLRQKEKLNGRA